MKNATYPMLEVFYYLTKSTIFAIIIIIQIVPFDLTFTKIHRSRRNKDEKTSLFETFAV